MTHAMIRSRIWIAVGVAAVAVVAASVIVAHEVTESRQAARVADLQLKKGIALYQHKAYPEAEDLLRQALRTNREDWQAPYYVGLVQIELKRFGLAVPYLELALSLNPAEAKVLTALGVTYFKLGRLDMAKGYFWAALAADPENADAQGLMETMAEMQWRAETTGVQATGHAPKH